MASRFGFYALIAAVGLLGLVGLGWLGGLHRPGTAGVRAEHLDNVAEAGDCFEEDQLPGRIFVYIRDLSARAGDDRITVYFTATADSLDGSVHGSLTVNPRLKPARLEQEVVQVARQAVAYRCGATFSGAVPATLMGSIRDVKFPRGPDPTPFPTHTALPSP